MLSKEAIEEFQQIWLKQYGRHINDNVAEKVAIKLLTIMRAIYKPILKRDSEIYEKTTK